MSRTLHRASAGPDFICIGAQKAGTGWLYEQLRNHPDFWMPPIKELHYFDRVGASASSRSLPPARGQQDRIRVARERARDQRDQNFLDRFEQLLARGAIDPDQYAALFADEGDLITGDITPGYSTLDDSVVEKIAEHFPAVRILFIGRDPVERAWSQLSMYVRRGLIERFEADDVEAIIKHLQRPEFVSRSYPSQIVRRWRRFIQPDRFNIYLFDDLKNDPVRLRTTIIDSLGGDPQKPSGALAAGYNAKAKKEKLALTDSVKECLANYFKAELHACCAELGGPACDWPKRYGF
jgi:sulfotransferase family protein